MLVELCFVSEEGQASAPRGTKRGRKSNIQGSSTAPAAKRRKMNSGSPAPLTARARSKSKAEVESDDEDSSATEPDSDVEEDQLRPSQYLDAGLQPDHRTVTPATSPDRVIKNEEETEQAVAAIAAAASAPISPRPLINVPSASVSVSISVPTPVKRGPGRPKGPGKKRAPAAEKESDGEYVPPKMLKAGSSSLRIEGTKRKRVQPSRYAERAP